MLCSLKQEIELSNKDYANRRFKIINEKINNRSDIKVYTAEPLNWRMNIKGNVELKFQPYIEEREIEFIDDLIQYQEFEQCLPENMRSYIVRVYERNYYEKKHVLILEAVSTDLDEWLKNSNNYLLRIKILKQISCAIRFLHSNQMYHRGIQIKNFHLFKNLRPEKEDEILVKLIDFGPSNKPNTLAQESYLMEDDILSLGEIFNYILSKNEFKPNIPHKFEPYSNLWISEKSNFMLNQLLNDMLQDDKTKRINIFEVIEELEQIRNQILSDFHEQSNSQHEEKKKQDYFQPSPFRENLEALYAINARVQKLQEENQLIAKDLGQLIQKQQQ